MLTLVLDLILLVACSRIAWAYGLEHGTGRWTSLGIYWLLVLACWVIGITFLTPAVAVLPTAVILVCWSIRKDRQRTTRIVRRQAAERTARTAHWQMVPDEETVGSQRR